MRYYVDRDNVPQIAGLSAADHEPDDLISLFGHKRSALARLEIILKLEPRIRDVVGERGVVDFIELFEVGLFVIAYLSSHRTRR